MSDEPNEYAVTVHKAEEARGRLVLTFVPRMHQRGPNGVQTRLPQFVVSVDHHGEQPIFDWSRSPDDPGGVREELEAEAAIRFKDRAAWIDRVNSLVNQVENWANEAGWSTRRVEKKLEDDWIGKHAVPALLIQQDTCRALLEPVGRSSSGAEGVVDLYLMPSYDDIASLYYYGDQWKVHYLFPDSKPVSTLRDADSMALSKETLEKVLGEMRRNAA